MSNKSLGILLIGVLIVGCNRSDKNGETNDQHTGATKMSLIHYKEESHLKNIRQLTFGGDNAEAYWSFDDSKLVFQSTNLKWGVECDQIYFTNWQTSQMDKIPAAMISTGRNRINWVRKEFCTFL